VNELSPETMRLLLRNALRQARKDAKIEPRAVTDPLGWSVSKLIRIEQGAVSVGLPDLRALLDAYGVVDTERRAELEVWSRGSRRRAYPVKEGVVTDAAVMLFGTEPDAETISKYAPSFLPGLMQTEEYATALLVGLKKIDRSKIDEIVKMRIERQDLLRRETRPRLRYVIGETALRRCIGGVAVMHRQLERLIEESGDPLNELQVIEFSAGSHPRMSTAFTVLEFGVGGLNSLLYLEDANTDSISREAPEQISEYLADFEALREIATPPERFEAVVRSIIQRDFSA
jgi:hypothetical protein